MSPQPDVANVKVIYSGKILADEKRIADVGIKEKVRWGQCGRVS